jgi:hypothetical protein
MSISPVAVWEIPFKVAVTLMGPDGIPVTVMSDGYGVAAPA